MRGFCYCPTATAHAVGFAPSLGPRRPTHVSDRRSRTIFAVGAERQRLRSHAGELNQSSGGGYELIDRRDTTIWAKAANRLGTGVEIHRICCQCHNENRKCRKQNSAVKHFLALSKAPILTFIRHAIISSLRLYFSLDAFPVGV